jgi:hypothetical protein
MTTQFNVGVTAAVALWFTWREVIPRIWNMKANGNGKAGMQSVDFWKNEFRTAQRGALEEVLIPKFDQQICILSEIKLYMADSNKALAVLLASDQKRKR